MKRLTGVVLAALVPLSSLMFIFAGCGDATTADDEAITSEADGLWRRRGVPHRPPPPPPPPGGTVDAGSGGAGPGSDVGCEICTEAQACCEAVSGSSTLCSFNADTCAAMNDAARPGYIDSCKTQKATTQFAWQQAQRTPPASCL